VSVFELALPAEPAPRWWVNQASARTSRDVDHSDPICGPGLAIAWNIAGGYAGLISFGHAAFFGNRRPIPRPSSAGEGPRITPWIGNLARRASIGGLRCNCSL